MILSSNAFPPNLLSQQHTNFNVRPVDSMAPLSQFAKEGYYVVDKAIFRHKIYAMQEATRKGLKPKDITWVFNDDVFGKLDWKTPSDLPLTEWYRRRAQQLRDKYDYLVLAFSGGGDSSNVLDSFVLNNIHLDEVVVHWPRKQTAGKYTPNTSTDASNLMSEWDFLVVPKLKWLEKAAPRIKITIADNLVEMKAEEPYEKLVEITTRHTWNGVKRYQAFDNVLAERQKKHKNCAIIMGVNPPFPMKFHRHLMFYFADAVTSSMYGSDYTEFGLVRNVEYFYWTPEMPELVREQAHALLNNLRKNPTFLKLIPSFQLGGTQKQPELTRRDRENQRRWIKSVLYPTYDHQLLQVDKNTSPIHKPEWFSWIYNNPHSVEIVQPHMSAITSYQKLIHPDFLVVRNNEVHDYYLYMSKLHYVGDFI